jgi:hypothetical protein
MNAHTSLSDIISPILLTPSLGAYQKESGDEPFCSRLKIEATADLSPQHERRRVLQALEKLESPSVGRRNTEESFLEICAHWLSMLEMVLFRSWGSLSRLS